MEILYTCVARRPDDVSLVSFDTNARYFSTRRFEGTSRGEVAGKAARYFASRYPVHARALAAARQATSMAELVRCMRESCLREKQYVHFSVFQSLHPQYDECNNGPVPENVHGDPGDLQCEE